MNQATIGASSRDQKIARHIGRCGRLMQSMEAREARKADPNFTLHSDAVLDERNAQEAAECRRLSVELVALLAEGAVTDKVRDEINAVFGDKLDKIAASIDEALSG
ncbi:MAG: hypothetical protein OES09_00125 [Gammaproteobacteria bacterium]|nr:hypothetical protein [Gammaproteobacteria bacterium]